MLRDFKFLRRNSAKDDEIENVPVNSRDSLSSQASTDSSFRAPLNSIQAPVAKWRQEPESVPRSKIERTPTKPRAKNPDSTLSLRTPDRCRAVNSSKNRFGWSEKNHPSLNINGQREDLSREATGCNGGLTNMTPRPSRRAPSGCYESTSTQSTPTKSVSKPPASGFRSKMDSKGGLRSGAFSSLYKGASTYSGPTTIVNTVEVPHFDLKEHASFWMDHNVQVVIRVRPLNNMEKGVSGYNRCLKQESSQSVIWIGGQPETRFTFDNIACEAIDQETLFRMAGLPMVENCLSGYNSSIFAYGQTGSGKTYTMLGEIEELDVNPSSNRGMMPRIFEYLFARIQAEEDSRRDEMLKYNCKCSFLEIYNEQISDLLDPSSTNLTLREDVMKGVYVENLSEYEVQSVGDILKLIHQGSLNRKVAATNMNRESSRSHSVFTCIIESRWERESATNLRFARFNLVDLAGSERQKTSGAEGERLKEAANINKSLSTLGHVIMILVDVANGKTRHVPYRDSRLTFLLQDSLGGNSKTMIIANVSPSICCAAETLNTLRFAQRAKFIQNNAVVNEDSTGDVIALQKQIRLLKEELSILKRQNVARSLSFGSTTANIGHDQTNPRPENTSEMEKHQDNVLDNSRDAVTLSPKKLESLKTTLAGALRREQMADTSIKNLEAEIEQLNRLVRQREEDTRSTKMMLRFREEKIQRMKTCLEGCLPTESFLLEENKKLAEEIQLLQAKIERNPEVTRFAVENIRLLDQLRRYQEFHEEGERISLLAEISNMREQLLQFLEGNSELQTNIDFTVKSQDTPPPSKEKNSLQEELKNTASELAYCRANLSACSEENEKLSREISDLHAIISYLKSGPPSEDANKNTLKDSLRTQHDKPDGELPCQLEESSEEIIKLQLDLDILKIMLEEERFCRGKLEEQVICLERDLELSRDNLQCFRKKHDNAISELQAAKSRIEALEAQHILSIHEIKDPRQSNEGEHHISRLNRKPCSKELQDCSPVGHLDKADNAIKLKFKRMQNSLEKVTRVKTLHLSDMPFQELNEKEINEVRCQAEDATAEAIVCMQEELELLQQEVQQCRSRETETKNEVITLEAEINELQEKLNDAAKENNKLLEKLVEKDTELGILSNEMELLACEVDEILNNENDSLTDACNQIDLTTSSFPQKRIWISEQFGSLIRTISQKEILIEELGRCLEDANNKIHDVEHMLASLRGATLVMNEAHSQECHEKDKEILCLTSDVRATAAAKSDMEKKLTIAERNSSKILNCATAAFIIVNRLSEVNAHKDMQLIVAEKQNESLKQDIARMEESCDQLWRKLSEEEERALTMEQALDRLNDNNISMAKGKLSALKSGVSELRSCMNLPAQHDRSPEKGSFLPDNHGSKGQSISETDQAVFDREATVFDREATVFDREATITLLRKEIESALESLEEVQTEMAKLREEKADLKKSEKQSKESLSDLTAQFHDVEAAINTFMVQSKLQIEALARKLEGLEFQIVDANILAAQRGVEASYILTKFEEARDIIEETNIMINELMITIEKMNVDIERQKQRETTLVSRVQDLESDIDLKDQQFMKYEKQSELNLLELRDAVAELEGIIRRMQESSSESLTVISDNFRCMRSFVLRSTAESRSSLEDIWSEIITKDCAISVLHLFHMGVLLETVTGMNTENSLLQFGLRESNSSISELREHNLKLRAELDMCRILKGKLLADIKNSFQRISRNEEQTSELGLKFSTFELKILDLQHEEELMLERSNCMASQLAVLMKDLDLSNQNMIATLLYQDKLQKENEELLHYEAEGFFVNFCSKDIEFLILKSALEEAHSRLGGTERELSSNCAIIENLREKLILSKVDEELREQCMLDREGDAAQLQGKLDEMESEMKILLSDLNQSKSRAKELDRLSRSLANHIQQLGNVSAENMALRDELLRKDDVQKGLLFDMRLLQESASKSKDQKDEMDEMMVYLKNLEGELAFKSSELEKALSNCQIVNTKVQEKMDEICSLKINIARERESTKLLLSENLELKAQVAEMCTAKSSLEEELSEKRQIIESMEMEIAGFKTTLEKMNATAESLQYNFVQIMHQKDHLQEEVLYLRVNREKAEAEAKEFEAKYWEAEKMAESKRTYVEEREEEIKLLERSVEELESTVNVLENKVELVRGEAERQRLQREELASELQAINEQVQYARNTNADLKRHIDKKDKDLREALTNVYLLEKETGNQNDEIAQLKAHILELTLHAEAQSSENKQKFMALEAMAEHVKPENHYSHAGSSGKSYAKPRGSGSPFKCIGLGLAHQIKSENDEELIVARQRVEELESLAASRQKEVFALKTKLAAAESMTHDVIRDLLGVKLDMTNYVSLLDNQQVHKLTEEARLRGSEDHFKPEAVKLRQKLQEFIQERRGWTEEMERKHAELIAAQNALEKLHQQVQWLVSENEILKGENTSHKKKISELEEDVKKLWGQQNLQQRIHHHAKIKEENNMLKIQNGDLILKLQRYEVVISRAKEELAHYRATIGKGPCGN